MCVYSILRLKTVEENHKKNCQKKKNQVKGKKNKNIKHKINK